MDVFKTVNGKHNFSACRLAILGAKADLPLRHDDRLGGREAKSVGEGTGVGQILQCGLDRDVALRPFGNHESIGLLALLCGFQSVVK